ncbi:MAG TPA: GNAT family N-acetyltransferase [Ktedonobacterales bacterium]|nr:GNAT family N-acetyltransferase [Ktedonobacterales bacterium]
MTSGSEGQRDVLPIRCILPDGAVVLLRAVRLDDTARLERLFYRLSPASITSYFFLPLPRQPQWAARLSEMAWADGVDRSVLVALVDEEIVGVARYDRTATEEAEFALLIEDGWQQRGLGKRLLVRLVNEARRHGIGTFRAYIQGENQRAFRLVRALFATVEPQWYGPECLILAPFAALRPESHWEH